MTFSYSNHSAGRLTLTHPFLREIFELTLPVLDHRVEESLRSLAQQQKKVDDGVSQTLQSWHLPQNDPTEPANNGLSWAVDVRPCVEGRCLAWVKPADPKAAMEWAFQYAYFIGYVMKVGRDYLDAVADQTGEVWELTNGSDWDSDNILLSDQKFQDPAHWQLEYIGYFAARRKPPEHWVVQLVRKLISKEG